MWLGRTHAAVLNCCTLYRPVVRRNGSPVLAGVWLTKSFSQVSEAERLLLRHPRHKNERGEYLTRVEGGGGGGGASVPSIRPSPSLAGRREATFKIYSDGGVVY